MEDMSAIDATITHTSNLPPVTHSSNLSSRTHGNTGPKACENAFHAECIQPWLDQRPLNGSIECPACRAPLEGITQRTSLERLSRDLNTLAYAALVMSAYLDNGEGSRLNGGGPVTDIMQGSDGEEELSEDDGDMPDLV